MLRGCAFGEQRPEFIAGVPAEFAELLLEGVLAVVNAFIDGLLKVFADLLKFLFDADNGLLTRTINISCPVLSCPVLSCLCTRSSSAKT